MLSVRIGRKHVKPSFRFDAVVDTGSPYCLFRADIGRYIGIDIEKGIQQDVGGVVAGMGEPGYFHKVNLYIEMNWIVEINAGFVENLSVAGLLGRRGFFENFTASFDHSSLPPIMEIERIPRVH